MSTPLFANNAVGTLATAITNVGGTLTLTSGHGARFPSPAANEHFVVTVQSGAAFEIMHCTGRSADALAVARGREGTSARSFPAGASVTMRVTAGLFDFIMDALLPPAVALPCFAANPPAGWLACYGQAVSRAAYPILFAALGTAYGPGNGTTTFNLPDLRGRVIAGLDDMGGVNAGRLTPATVIGWSGGAQSHTLTATEMPSHGHTVAPGAGDHTHTVTITGGEGAHGHALTVAPGGGSHSHSGTAESAGSHQHDYNAVGSGTLINGGTGYGNTTVVQTSSAGDHTHTVTIPASGEHGHTVTTTGSDGTHSHNATLSGDGKHSHTLTNTGGGQSHNNVQPTMAALWILRGI